MNAEGHKQCVKCPFLHSLLHLIAVHLHIKAGPFCTLKQCIQRYLAVREGWKTHEVNYKDIIIFF